MSQISLNTLPLPKRLDSEDSREDLLEDLRELQERKGWKHFLHRLEDLAEQADRQLRTETDLHLLPHLQGLSKAYHKVLDLPREMEEEVKRMHIGDDNGSGQR